MPASLCQRAATAVLSLSLAPQAARCAPGANPLGFVTSNGVLVRIG